MSLVIPNVPNSEIYACGCVRSLNQSVQAKLTPGEKLTNAKALAILDSIKSRSALLSVLTKPVILISLSWLILIGGLLIPVVSTSFLVIKAVLCGLGGGLVSFTITATLRGTLPQISREYEIKAEEARKCIREIEQTKSELTFVL